MKIAININELTLKQNTGVKTYTREIVRALGEVDKENKYILYANCREQVCLFPTAENFKLKTSKSLLPFWTYTKLSREIKKDKLDILFMPIQATPFLKKPKNIKLVVTVHDLAFLLFPKHFTFKDRFLLDFHTKRAVQMADKIIAPSEATKRDIVKFYGVDEGKIEVVWHGVKRQFEEAELPIGSSASGLANKRYIFFVGSIQPRKNLVRLIEAFEILKTKFKRRRHSRMSPAEENCKLIIAGGKGWLSDEIYRKAKESKFSDEIIFKGSVSDDELANLYKNAAVFVMPSLYEGFGLPVLEAMSYGIPCVVSDNSSLREIAINNNEQACLFTTGDSNDIAEKINALLSDEGLRKELSEKGIENARRFSWEKAAREMIKVFTNFKRCDIN
ncbi:MAG: glycosyltransferase family 4 protein [Candidatus Pacebacteria bacterium]|nr:glycosyltransferase family 4 protein [Candidatus Paceibacterota bacterium]